MLKWYALLRVPGAVPSSFPQLRGEDPAGMTSRFRKSTAKGGAEGQCLRPYKQHNRMEDPE